MAYSNSFKAPRWAKRQIDRLDVPDCGCLQQPVCDCTCDGPCKCRPLLFAPPCEHVLAADHSIPFERWAEMLLTAPPPEHDSNQPSLPATDRTNARPGTAAKIDVMMERVARGEGCFAPGDLDMTNVDRLAYALTAEGWRLVEERPEPPPQRRAA